MDHMRIQTGMDLMVAMETASAAPQKGGRKTERQEEEGE